MEAEARVVTQAGGCPAHIPVPQLVELAQRLLVRFRPSALCQPFQKGVAIPERVSKVGRDGTTESKTKIENNPDNDDDNVRVESLLEGKSVGAGGGGGGGAFRPDLSG